MTELPSGTVTFLFTDVEGSTRLLNELGDAYADVLAEHRRVLREAFAQYGGVEVDTQGDAFFVAFARASDALAAAQDACSALNGPIRVRIGLHTGEPLVTEEGYVGIDVHRAARIAAAGHGGQILVSQSTRELVGADVLRDLGEHRLKDLSAPERIYQLGDGDFPRLKTLYQTSLPVQPTPLVGRKQELQEIGELLRSSRLLTLTGPGGSGKTRLALQVAAEAAEQFPDGVWFVSLASLTDHELVEPTIAQVIGARGDLTEFLRGKRLLLLLDNLEQLLPEVAPRIARLDASILATSRERLNIAAEWEYPVATLPIDDAVALFVQRARQLKPAFRPDDHVTEIARRLDGLPLALELAAARVKVLTPMQIVQRLGQSLDLLTGGTLDAPRRQRTLRATIEWSYELLDENERQLFTRLSVFPGSFDLAAAEAVADAEIALLASLVDKSLLREDEGRFSMLETIREYGVGLLEDTAGAADMHKRHADFFLRFAEQAQPSLDRIDGIAAVAPEVPNLRAALGWLHDHAPDNMLRLAAALWRFWYHRGEFSEGRRWLKQALTGSEGAPLSRAHALRGLAALFIEAEDADPARPLVEEALSLYSSEGDDEGVARCLNSLGAIAHSQHDLARAERSFESSLAISKELAARGRGPGTAVVLGNLAGIAVTRGDLRKARSLTEVQLRAAWAEANDLAATSAQTRLAWLDALDGRFSESARGVREVLDDVRAIGGRHPGELYLLAAVLAGQRDDWTAAARLVGAVESARVHAGLGSPDRSLPVMQLVVRLEQELEARELATEVARGRELSFDDLLKLASAVVD